MSEAIRLTSDGKSPWPLVLTGPPGTGKTCAALCLLDHAGGEYFTAGGLCEVLIASQQGRLTWHHEARGGTLWPELWWERLRREPLVVLDEVGTRERVSDHHYDAVKRMLDERHRRPLVVCSNLGLNQIARVYDDRLASRLAEGTVVEVVGSDRRLS